MISERNLIYTIVMVKYAKDLKQPAPESDVTHNALLEIIDRAYIMHDGQVLMEGRPDEVVANEDVRRVYLGERFTR